MTEKRFALIVADYEYEDDGLSQLVAPPQDAEALAQVLKNPAIGGFEVEMLLNKRSYEVSQKIEAFLSDSMLNHLLLLYFSGHGIKDEEGRLYFATRDTRRKLLQSTAVRANFVNNMMRRSRSRQQVLLLDCCYSGAFPRGMVAKSDTHINIKENFEGRGRVVLTASDAMQYAFEGDEIKGQGVRSVFTHNLVAGLETGEADIDQDGFISFDELYDFVFDRVTRERPEQRPEKWTFGFQGKIIIAKSVKPRSVTLPESIERLLKSNLRSDLIVAIDDLGELIKEFRVKDKELADLAIEKIKELYLFEDKAIQDRASDTLKKLGIPPPNAPIIRFQSGRRVNTLDDWVELAEQHWEEAAEFLYDGNLEKWLDSVNQLDLAGKAEQIRIDITDDRFIGLEHFQRVAGSFAPQSKSDAHSNMNDLFGKFNYWKLRKQKEPVTLRFKITNQGRGYMHGFLVSKVDWIKISNPRFGCFFNQTDEVEIVVNPVKRKTWHFSLSPLHFILE